MEDTAEACPVVLLQFCAPDIAAQRHGDATLGCVGELEAASVRNEQSQGSQSISQGMSDVYVQRLSQR